MSPVNSMKGKEFSIKPKSAIKRDKAIAKLDRLLEQIEELRERKAIVQAQIDKMTTELSRLNKIVRDNS